MTKGTKLKLLKFLLISLFMLSGMGLVLYGARGALSFFYIPSNIAQASDSSKIVRLGGVVKAGSLVYLELNKIIFIITDSKHDIIVEYEGVLPKLFRELQTVVVKGYMRGGQFQALEVLAKHDENYFPPGLKKE